MNRKAMMAGLYLLVLGGIGAVAAWTWADRNALEGNHATPGLGPMDAATAEARVEPLLGMMLTAIYDAFAMTEEARIYDTLAIVSSGAALEALYLERAGTMADGGLTSDQTVHELNLTEVEASRRGAVLTVDVRWEVIGTVGHEEHQHLRGNSYAARLTVEPVDGAWRITAFELVSVTHVPDIPAATDPPQAAEAPTVPSWSR
jgi:hypothetical protein